MIRRLTSALTVLALALCAAIPCNALAVEAPGSFAFSSPGTFAPPFGEHGSLSLATDASGEAVFAWRAEVGREHEVQSATLLPGSFEGGATQTIAASTAPVSEPVLADQGGSAAIAWFTETPHSIYEQGLVSLELSSRTRRGRWQAPSTVWRAPAGAGYEYEGLALAGDSAGDQVIAWLTRREHPQGPDGQTVIVSSRSAGGSFARPVTLTTDSIDVAPVVAMNPLGEATVIWCSSAAQRELLSSTWRAGGVPGAATVLDEARPGSERETEQFRDLAIQEGEGGDELATWLNGPAGGRPLAVALKAAWRAPGAQFSPTESVSSPGVEAREPTMSLSPSGASIVWSEINAAGEGPLLNAATAADGETLTAGEGSPLPRSFGVEPNLRAATLTDGAELVTWRSGSRLLAAQRLADGALSLPVVVAQLGEVGSIEEDNGGVVAGPPGSSLIAWIGRSPLDFASDAVRYVLVTSSSNPPPVASLVELAGGSDIAAAHGVRVRVRCSEACAVAAKAKLFGVRRESARFAAGDAYRPIGSLAALSRRLRANRTIVLWLRATKRLLAVYCRSVRDDDADAVEVRVAARAVHGGAARRVVLGLEPSGGAKACGR